MPNQSTPWRSRKAACTSPGSEAIRGGEMLDATGRGVEAIEPVPAAEIEPSAAILDEDGDVVARQALARS